MKHLVKHPGVLFLLAVFMSLTLALFVRDLGAEAIFMKDGRVIYGRVLSQDERQMEVRTRYGIIRLLKANIQRIDYDLGLGTVTVVMRDDRTVNGTLISITAAKVVVREDTAAAIEHDIPRSGIESLVLRKFEGRRDNTFGIAGGFVKTRGSLAEQMPAAAIDFTAFYRRQADILPGIYWGASASYIRFKTNDDRTPLEDAKMTINPFLLHLEARYPLLGLAFDGAWARGIAFCVDAGAGVSYVTLTESKESRTGSYLTIQPAAGLSYIHDERIFITLRAGYLYIHQSELSYEGIRAQLGAGYVF